MAKVAHDAKWSTSPSPLDDNVDDTEVLLLAKAETVDSEEIVE